MPQLQRQHACVALLISLMLTPCITQADVVVVVSAKSPVGPMTKAQVADIYLGRSRDFPSGGAAIPIIDDAGQTRAEFFEKVLGKSEQQARAVWSRLAFTGAGTPPKEMPSSAEMKKVLANNPNTIGFLERSEVDGQIKIVFEP